MEQLKKLIKPLTLVMTDLETTGINPKITEILEVAAVEVEFNGIKMIPKSHFHEYIQTDTKANKDNPFVMKYQAELYKKCNELPKEKNLENCKMGFKNYLQKVYPNQNPKEMNTLPQFCGQNFSIFDAPYLLEYGFIQGTIIDKLNNMTSNFNYRSVELQAYSIPLSVALGYKSTTEFMKYAASLDTETQLPEGSAHTALYDCYNQIKFFNGVMKLINIEEIIKNHSQVG